MSPKVKSRLSTAAFLLVGMVLSGCFYAGKWDDSPKNWKRAFNQKAPKEVAILHSRFWRSPHFTYEAEFFFEFRAPDELIKSWIKQGRLAPRTPTRETVPSYFDKPPWFTPGRLTEYEIWAPSDDPRSKFRLFKHRTNGVFYVTDCST
jgi:hypothetical protein